MATGCFHRTRLSQLNNAGGVLLALRGTALNARPEHPAPEGFLAEMLLCFPVLGLGAFSTAPPTGRALYLRAKGVNSGEPAAERDDCGQRSPRRSRCPSLGRTPPWPLRAATGASRRQPFPPASVRARRSRVDCAGLVAFFFVGMPHLRGRSVPRIRFETRSLDEWIGQWLPT
jgi:hypothetical protein